MEERQRLREKYQQILPHLNEQQKRLFTAAEARYFDNITYVQQASGVARTTIRRGIRELSGTRELPKKNIRHSGGGRKPKTAIDQTLSTDLEALVSPTARGDPMSPLRWTTKSLTHLADKLKITGHHISHTSVGKILKELGYSLQSQRKRDEGKQHPDRDAQFQHIAEVVKTAIAIGIAVLSIDCKKKELIGNFKHTNGKEYHKQKEPEEVNAYDFKSMAEGKAIPYGVYDITKNKGFINVGISRDTAQFAVASIRKWWELIGKEQYALSEKIIVTADSGGSNSARARLWKWELQKLANEIQKPIQVLHFPPGTSKWNKIEHRLFSYISLNWRGRSLATYETIISLISNTITKKGLTVTAEMDWDTYEKGIKITDEEMDTINKVDDLFHPEWNYTIYPNG